MQHLRGVQGCKTINDVGEKCDMKIVHLLLNGQLGGIENLTYDIALNSSDKHIVYFIFNGGPVSEKMIAAKIQVEIAHTPKYHWKKAINSFVQFCLREKVNVVVNHFEAPVAWAHALAIKRKCNVVLLGYMHWDVRNIKRKWKGKVITNPVNKIAYRRCDRVIAISQFVKNTAMESFGLSPKDVDVIYNGVDVLRFAYSNTSKKEEPMKLLFVGRLIRDKGVHVLLAAISQLPVHIKVHTTIVGDGPEYEALVQMARELDVQEKVTFLGKRTDIPELLHETDFFVHPAVWQEGFGITLIEAMACGKPCIVSNGGAVKEIIDPKSGILFGRDSVSELVSAVTDAHEIWGTDKYTLMAQAARKSSERFAIGHTITKLEETYSELYKKIYT